MSGDGDHSGSGSQLEPSRAVWPSWVVEEVEAALASAREVRATVLTIEGEPGMGKSTLLQEVVARATGFRVLYTEGDTRGAGPFTLLQQLNVTVSPSVSPFLAAQQVREDLDAVGWQQPVLLVVDDLQWADPESVEALSWMLRRSVGERLLMAVATRPLSNVQHPTWQRGVRNAPVAHRVHLSGMGEDEVLTMVRERQPLLSESSARALWTHTGGHPLYLNALLAEQDPEELIGMRVMPAPAEFERLIAERLTRLDPDSLIVVRALAVLGLDWLPLGTVAAVAGVGDDVVAAVDRVEQAGLVRIRPADGIPSVRLTHALTRSAIYYSAPLGARRDLHLRAAAHASTLEEGLEHRVRAATSFDDQLAEDLADYSEVLHQRHSFRLAGQYLDWASTVTVNAGRRDERRLDALFERQLAGQEELVDQELAAIPAGSDTDRTLLLRGHAALLAGYPAQAAHFLSAVTTGGNGGVPDAATRHADAKVYGRARALLVNARMRAGDPTSVLQDDLARIAQAGGADPALWYYEASVGAIVQMRTTGLKALLDDVSFLPPMPEQVPEEQILASGWRGTVRLVAGVIPEGLEELRQASERLEATGVGDDPGQGARRSAIGLGYWLHGQWDRARVTFRLVRDTAANPLTTLPAYRSLVPSGTGDFVEADRYLAHALELTEREPWQEAALALLFARVVRLHASGDRQAQAVLLEDTRTRWPNISAANHGLGPLAMLPMATAALWAGELDVAAACIDELARPEIPTRWTNAASNWLQGLLAEQQGQLDDALSLCRLATAAASKDLPLYRAHMFSDHARLAHQLGNTLEGQRINSEGQRIYRALGARPYLRESPVVATSTPHREPIGSSARTLGERFGLSEREVDVATLVSDGLSYAQVARELFISRSTVGFHLGNIYAKTGVASRHELLDLARTVVL